MNQKEADEAFDALFATLEHEKRVHFATSNPYWKGVPQSGLCSLVNPLCPDDLCILPADHVGADEGWHWLSTSGQATKVSPVMWMGPKRSRRRTLMNLAYAEFE